MTFEETRSVLEKCIRDCRALLDRLLSGMIPTDETIRDVRFRVWDVSEQINDSRAVYDRYETELRRGSSELQQLETEICRLHEMLNEYRAEYQTLTEECAQSQSELRSAEYAVHRAHSLIDESRKNEPTCAAPEKARRDNALASDDPALLNTLEMQNEMALGQQ